MPIVQSATPRLTLQVVVERLSRHGQSATYSAVGGVVGRHAIGVMQGQLKTHQYSWVVAKKTGEPSGYTPVQRDPRLPGQSDPINTIEELLRWPAKNH